MNEIGWYTDESGRMLGTGIHDAELFAFSTSSPGKMRLDLRQTARLLRADFLGVREITIAELWERAILSEIFVWKAGSVPEETWSIPDGGWRALFRNRLSVADARRAALAIAARRPEPWLVQITCSYGGSIAIVCDSIHISEAAGAPST